HALGIHGHGAADGKIRVLSRHRPTRHDQQLVHVGRAGNDGLGAADHDAIAAALLDVHVDIGIGLPTGPLRAVTLGIGHGDTERQVLVLNAVKVVDEAGVIFGAV